MQMAESTKILKAIAPIDINGAGANGTAISMKNYSHLTIIIKAGVMNDSASSAVTLGQAKEVAWSTYKALGFDWMWTKATSTEDFTKTAVTSDTFNITGTDDGAVWVIEVDASELDTANGYDCVRVELATPGAYSTLVDATYILSGPRQAGDGAAMGAVLTD